MTNDAWTPCAEKLPPPWTVVFTKIVDPESGNRSLRFLYRSGKIWWDAATDDQPEFIIDPPTHWRECP